MYNSMRFSRNGVFEYEKSKQDEDYLQFQLAQISALKLQECEDLELERELARLSNVSEIKQCLWAGTSQIQDDENSILSTLSSLSRNFSQIENVDEELKRVETADFDLCDALLTLLLREDHFAQYGCFERRCEKGDVQKIVDRMIYVLENREFEIRKRLQGRAAEYMMFMDD